VQDSASTTGGGKTGIAYNASGLTAYYVRPGGSATAITLATQTVTGAWSSGGWVEVDATNLPGIYRFDIPNAVFASGVDHAVVMLKGASGMAPVSLEYQLVGFDPSTAWLTTTQTAQAVWNATASTYNTAGSMGEAGQKLTGYSLASSQTFSTTGAVGSVTGSVGSVTGSVGSVTGAVGSVTGAVGSVTGAVGSVTGAVTVGTNNDKTGYALSTGGVSAVAGKVWDEPYTSHTTANTFGARILLTTVDNRPADVGTSNHIQANVHAIVDSTVAASELSGALLHNGTDYISAELVTPVSTASLIYMGPFQVIADGVTTPQPLDIQKGTQQGIGIQLVDNNLAGISITGATITAKVYNSGGTLVATYSGTATYAADGRAQFTITTTVTNTPGTYTATITRTTGASDTQIFGPLRIYVRDI